MRFMDKIVWITGASSGIGEALAKAFAAEGAHIILSGRRTEALEKVAGEAGIPFESVELPGMRDADVVITITSSFEPSLLSDHISDGTHIACMGTDTIGKQEIETSLVARAAVFTDEIASL